MVAKSPHACRCKISGRIRSAKGAGMVGLLRRVSTWCLVCILIGCSRQPPLVTEPPEDMSRARLADPWLIDERAMMRNPSTIDSSDIHRNEGFQGALEGAPPRTAMDTFVDIIAFPFRGIGWLLRTIF